MKKKTFILFSCFALLLSFTTGVWAEDARESIKAYLSSNIKLTINNEEVQLNSAPIEYNGETYLPVSELNRVFGIRAEVVNSATTIKITSNQWTNTSTSNNNNNNTGSNSNNSSEQGYANNYKPNENGTTIAREEIRLEDVMIYEYEFKNEEYSVVGNEYKGTMYFRYMDVEKMNLKNFTPETFYKEEYTGQKYIEASEFGDYFNNSNYVYPSANTVSDPVMTGVTKSKIRTALKKKKSSNTYFYYPHSYADDIYYMVYETQGEFKVKKLKIKQYSSGTYYASVVSTKDMYDDDDDDDDD
ncbi:stalk domain-containing protein [Longirhabdus pacifica]|uniref:stalk domain-containing protein n=1 Tax=Longirhabdus pacifica TaxID=2305227 RepID=UPI0013E8F218|nr:stalk domain-containing protein [Longirhabdus pacifica]